MTNAELIAKIMVENGPKSVLIYTVPSSQFWIVMLKTSQSTPKWRALICNPEQMHWRLITKHITDEEHMAIWKTLITTEINRYMNHSIQELKKSIQLFKRNKSNNKSI